MSGRLFHFSGLCSIASSWDVRIRHRRRREQIDADSFLPIADSAPTTTRSRKMSRIELEAERPHQGGPALNSDSRGPSQTEKRATRE